MTLDGIHCGAERLQMDSRRTLHASRGLQWRRSDVLHHSHTGAVAQKMQSLIGAAAGSLQQVWEEAEPLSFPTHCGWLEVQLLEEVVQTSLA